MNPNLEPAYLILDFLDVLNLPAWSDDLADDFLDWIAADTDRADVWHLLREEHELDDRGLIEFAFTQEVRPRRQS